MKASVIALVAAGTFFGLIVGWIIGSQQSSLSRGAAPPPAAAAGTQAATPAANAPAPIDETRANELIAKVQSDPKDVKSRVDLGNLYYDAARYNDAVKWYSEAMALAPNDVNVSTDLGVSYWNLNQPDQALKQFEHSLSIDPRHQTTLLNQGIVRAFGKQDLEGAAASWQKAIEIAPDSEQGKNAKRLLDGLKSAHPGIGGGTAQPASTPRG